MAQMLRVPWSEKQGFNRASSRGDSSEILDCIIVGDVMIDLVLKSAWKIADSLKIDGTNYFSEAKITPGGSGNIAAALAWLGGNTAFMGKAGNDMYGKLYQDDLESSKVVARIQFDTVTPTGFAVCLVEPDGKRTMLVSRGANDKLTPSEVREGIQELGPSKFLYFPGYSLVNSPQREAVLEAAAMARRGGIRVVFDPGSSNLIQEIPGFVESAVARSDVICANLNEAEELAGGEKVEDYASTLSKKGKLVLVKRGSEGCLLAVEGHIKSIGGVTVRSVDTTGAGDAFLGAFLYCTSHGYGTSSSASFANWFAAKTTEGLGPRNFPPKTAAISLLKSISEN